MKKYLFIVFALLSFSSFAQDNVESDLVGLRGQIVYGDYLNCNLFNHTEDDLTVVHYTYRVSYVDNFGSIRWDQKRLHCGFNCDIYSRETSRFTGPRNARNIISAQCWGRAQLLDDVIEELL